MNFQLIKEKEVKGFVLLEVIIVLLIVSILVSAFYFSNNNSIKNFFNISKNEEDDLNASNLCMYVGKFARRANLVYRLNGSDTIIFRRKENGLNVYYFFEKIRNNVILRSFNDTTKVKDNPNRWKMLKESTIRKNSYNIVANDVDEFNIYLKENTLYIEAMVGKAMSKDIVRVFRYEEN